MLISLFFVLNISIIAFSTEYPSDYSEEIEPSENIYDGQNEIPEGNFIIEQDDDLNKVSEEDLTVDENDNLDEMSEEDAIFEENNVYVEQEYTEYRYLNE